MHRLKNKLLLRYLKESGKVWTSPPGGTQNVYTTSHHKVCPIKVIDDMNGIKSIGWHHLSFSHCNN